MPVNQIALTVNYNIISINKFSTILAVCIYENSLWLKMVALIYFIVSEINILIKFR